MVLKFIPALVGRPHPDPLRRLAGSSLPRVWGPGEQVWDTAVDGRTEQLPGQGLGGWGWGRASWRWRGQSWHYPPNFLLWILLHLLPQLFLQSQYPL